MSPSAYEPARVLARRIRDRESTAVGILDAHLERIKTHAALNAVVSLDVDLAYEAALSADRALSRGETPGPLHGVPLTLKDCHDAAGLRTTVGTPVLDRIPEADGTVAARLRAAGAVIIGHTNVPPFLGAYRSENAIFGRTANPWDTARTPGGSSGGAAAALAAGLTPVEVGSDLAGSIRLPSHCCGVYGLKTTEHRVASTGYFNAAHEVNPVRVLSALGPMARDLDDLELVLRLISGPDGADFDVPPVPLPERRPFRLQDLRLATALELPWASVDESLREQVSRVAAACADAGAAVEPRLPDLDWVEQGVFLELMQAVTSALTPGSQRRTLDWYLETLHRRDAFAGAWEQFFTRHDALLLPPSSTAATAHDAEDVSSPGAMLVFANLAGLPALTVPAGFDPDGLPVGVQLVGPRWSEIRLIEIAAALEEAGVLPGFTRPPGY
ncbi:amidase [Glycomyces harbinensis]|uniref:Amidase n=1 Tax=Glycomyces harbinensis TaxID=58114 RepID=A0A1G7ADU0_9ACTN|nr:amidase family protein [Glycomyces harbinensis]SDE12205.1 amidase [Glycomyces harbinensis]